MSNQQTDFHEARFFPGFFFAHIRSKRYDAIYDRACLKLYRLFLVLRRVLIASELRAIHSDGYVVAQRL